MKLEDIVKKEFYKIVQDAQMGITLNVSEDDFSYVRFNYVENGKLYGEPSDEEYLGNPEYVDEEYDAEFSNGTAHYLPTLRVNNIDEFFSALTQVVEKYMNVYHFSKAIEKLGENNVVKSIILTIFSNARYTDYEHPTTYMRRYLDFFNDTHQFEQYIENISLLQDSNMEIGTRKEEFGFETPYFFETAITKGSDTYFLPNISYGISNHKCYIYAIQNKHKNEDTPFSKKIKRSLNKVNGNVVDDTDYDVKDTILGVPPSFVVALSVFLKTLHNHGIRDVEAVTFLPDRYFEKKASDEYDSDAIQSNLTERLVLLCYRIQNQISDIEIDYPIFDGIPTSQDVGDNVVIHLGENMTCHNNSLLDEIISKLDSVQNSTVK